MLFCFLYLPPEKSVYSDISGINAITSLELVFVLLGDLNTRVGCEQDYILNDSPKYLPRKYNYIEDNFNSQRLSRDHAINTYGRGLLNMCKEFEIHMLNGRSNLDKPGNFTYMGPNGNSVVDYIIVSTNIFDAFCDFQVLNNDESDHFLITCNIKTNTKPAVRDGDVFTRHRFKWNDKNFFKSLFYTDDTHRELEIVAEQIQEYKIDEAVNGLE
ncbi:hypothetical protein SNE40_019833 [Patella caerulea]|uniref:Endonuclease/exonuclease/phosphatase domain-containing protein n=1 Tax=Patella caerulea TaxID=87958 RepID=A0AAN8GDJ6_PATCE